MEADGASKIVRTARTPMEAQVLAAKLAAAGIPAFVEGRMLADEFAMSQALLNRLGVRIRVPAALLAKAEEVLAEPGVPDEELTRQALAAGDPAAEPEEPPDGA
ncbi:MAG: hypothetical protein Fur0037_14750 [Planctomycetota bacterium]